jgi:hypothetical protein
MGFFGAGIDVGRMKSMPLVLLFLPVALPYLCPLRFMAMVLSIGKGIPDVVNGLLFNVVQPN